MLGMKPRHFRLVSLIATFGLVAFIVSGWMKQPVPNVLTDAQNVKGQHLFCTGASTLSSYLAEVKPKFSATGATAVPATAGCNLVCPESVGGLLVESKIARDHLPRPLWLLNRSLLI